MIKIPVYVSYGGNPKPKGFASDKTGTEYLIELANYIVKNAHNPAVGIKTHTDKYGQVSYIIPYENDVDASWARVVIEDVDTSRPWEIVDYDGSESINYLDIRKFDKYNRAITSDSLDEDSTTTEVTEATNTLKISMTAVHDVIQNRSYTDLARATGLCQSSFSHYRHGRSIEDNIDVKRLYALTKMYQENHDVDSVDDYEFIESNIREDIGQLLNIRPKINYTRLNSRLKFIGESTIDDYTWMCVITTRYSGEVTYTQYQHLKVVRDALAKAVTIDEDKVYKNILRVFKSAGIPRYQLSLRVSPHANYIDRNLQRHRQGRSYISEWSDEVWQNIANAVYPDKPDNVKLLQQQVLRGVV